MGNPTGKGGFKKGQSGNPSGRPKTNPRYQELLDEILDSKKEGDITIYQKLIKKLAEEGYQNGNIQAITYLIDRRLGKAKQSMDINTEVTDSIVKELQELRESLTDETT